MDLSDHKKSESFEDENSEFSEESVVCKILREARLSVLRKYALESYMEIVENGFIATIKIAQNRYKMSRERAFEDTVNTYQMILVGLCVVERLMALSLK